MQSSGRRRFTPTFDASGSHHAPMPSLIRPGARSSSVENVAASRPTLRVHVLTTPEPMPIRSVTAAKAAIGTVASRTRRLSACHTASKPARSASDGVLHAVPNRMLVLEIERDAFHQEPPFGS